MTLLKSAHLGENFDPEIVRKLNLDVVHPNAPYHDTIPLGRYMPPTGIPTLWQASGAGFPNVFYTLEHFRNVLSQPDFIRWIVVGNEQDLGFGNISPATPHEFVESVVANMLVMIPIIPAPRRFILSLGSKDGFDRGWSEQVLREFQTTAPGILSMFDALAVNYYWQPLRARQTIRWLRSVRAVTERLGLDDKKIWLKEIGLGLPNQADEDAVAFITLFFGLLRRMQTRGDLAWLELVSWFSANDLSKYGMPYVTLFDKNGLTPAGKAWAKG